MWGWPSSLSSDLKLPEEHNLCWGLNMQLVPQGVTVGMCSAELPMCWVKWKSQSVP